MKIQPSGRFDGELLGFRTVNLDKFQENLLVLLVRSALVFLNHLDPL